MRDIEDFLPFITVWAPSVPEPVALNFLRQAAKELCQRTRCWRFTDSFQTTGDDIEVMCTPPCADLFEIEWARFDDMQLESRAPTGDMLFHDNGQPRYFYQTGPNTISLEPRAKGTLSLSLFLQPSVGTEMLPAFMLDQFGDALAAGALSRLLLLPNQPFQDANMAMVKAAEWRDVLDRNFAFNLRGQQRARKRTKSSFL